MVRSIGIGVLTRKAHDCESLIYGSGFKVTCDASLLPRISVRIGDAIEEFDATNFEQGLGRVRELFHGQ